MRAFFGPAAVGVVALAIAAGATMALHSTAGFGMAALGSWGIGAALDAAGGPDNPSAWTAAFCLMAAAVLIGPLALVWSRTEIAAG